MRDTADTPEGGYAFLALYVLAPEKFVVRAAFAEGGLGKQDLGELIMGVEFLLDLCGVGALVAMLAGGELIAALAVGYAATALGGLWLIYIHIIRML